VEIKAVVDEYRFAPGADFAAVQGFKRMHSPTVVKKTEHFLMQYRDLLEENPRAMKRLLNAYGFRRGFDILSRRGFDDQDALLRWTILENRWPILADYLANRSGGRNEPDIIKALMNDEKVLEVADGLTWSRLRPVPSAPNDPPKPEITPGPEPKAS
jgi:hypothetical protein